MLELVKDVDLSTNIWSKPDGFSRRKEVHNCGLLTVLSVLESQVGELQTKRNGHILPMN